jgi:eukaryotic-like serine/threonine-protein kinase
MRGTLKPNVVGSYRIEGLIAKDSLASVYRGTHMLLPRSAAIKVLHADLVEVPAASERLLQEARTLEAIDHHAILKVYEAGLLDGARPWVAMELIDGQTLADHLLVHGKLAPSEAASIVSAVVSALACAHSAGVIHRNLTPEHVILVARPGGPEIKLVDWGMADASSVTLCLSENDSASSYLSPEQLCGQTVDARTDIWNLGVLAYEMLAGHPPSAGPGPTAVAMNTLRGRVPPLALLLGVEMDDLIVSMLANDPARRPSLDVIAAGFAAWSRDLVEDYAEITLEVEIDLDFDRRDSRSGELTC